MLIWPPSVRVFVASGPADMRRGFDGLARMTTEVIKQDPLSGSLFVFRNRRGDRVKIEWHEEFFNLIPQNGIGKCRPPWDKVR